MAKTYPYSREATLQLLSSPQMQAFADMTSWAEGTSKSGTGNRDYNILFGGARVDNLSTHPNVKKEFSVNGKRLISTSAGAFQITNPTYNEFAPKLGLTDFSPQSQEMILAAMAIQVGADKDILENNIPAAIQKLTGRFASFAGSTSGQPQRSLESLINEYNIGYARHTGNQPPPMSMTSVPNNKPMANPSFSGPTTGVHYATPTVPGRINLTHPQGIELPQAPNMPGPPPSSSNIQARIREAVTTPRLAISTDQLSPETIANMEEALISPRLGTPVVSYPTTRFTSPTNTALVGGGLPSTPSVREVATIAPEDIQYYPGTPLPVPAARAMELGRTAQQTVPEIDQPMVNTTAMVPSVAQDIVTVPISGGIVTPEQLTNVLNLQQPASPIVIPEQPLTFQQAIASDNLGNWIDNLQSRLLNITNNTGINRLANNTLPSDFDSYILQALSTIQVPPVGA